MGLRSWLRGEYREGARGNLARLETDLAQRKAGLGYNAEAGVLTVGGRPIPVESIVDIRLELADGERVTAARVVGGALLAGPAGAVVGALVKKKTPTIYLAVGTHSISTRVPVPASLASWAEGIVELVAKEVQA